MLEQLRQLTAKTLTIPFVGILTRTRVSPNLLSLFGFALSLGIAWILTRGLFFLGGFLILFSGWFDLLDGALARAGGRVTRFGALLDSTLDRLSEAALFFGLLFFYIQKPGLLEPLLIYIALVGSMAVSYVRARAEGLGMELRVGLFTRPERVILLALGLILSRFFPQALLITLWILAIGASFTALHRVVQARRKRN